MPTETERRFLIKEMPWTHITHGLHTEQGYLSTEPKRIVRVRLQYPHNAASAIPMELEIPSSPAPSDITTPSDTTTPLMPPATSQGEQAFLTIKGLRQGNTCDEYEYPLPPEDARDLLKLCPDTSVEKIRYPFSIDGILWEIDVFLHANTGLTLAEATLENAQQTLELPDWIAEEISHDTKYSNVSLAKNPYSTWNEGNEGNEGNEEATTKK